MIGELAEANGDRTSLGLDEFKELDYRDGTHANTLPKKYNTDGIST